MTEDSNWKEWSHYVLEELKRNNAQLEKFGDKLSTLSSNVSRNTTILEEHQRRSLALEELVEVNKDSVENRLKLVERPVHFLADMAKIASWIAAISGVVGIVYGFIVFVIK